MTLPGVATVLTHVHAAPAIPGQELSALWKVRRGRDGRDGTGRAGVDAAEPFPGRAAVAGFEKPTPRRGEDGPVGGEIRRESELVDGRTVVNLLSAVGCRGPRLRPVRGFEDTQAKFAGRAPHTIFAAEDDAIVHKIGGDGQRLGHPAARPVGFPMAGFRRAALRHIQLPESAVAPRVASQGITGERGEGEDALLREAGTQLLPAFAAVAGAVDGSAAGLVAVEDARQDGAVGGERQRGDGKRLAFPGGRDARMQFLPGHAVVAGTQEGIGGRRVGLYGGVECPAGTVGRGDGQSSNGIFQHLRPSRAAVAGFLQALGRRPGEECLIHGVVGGGD